MNELEINLDLMPLIEAFSRIGQTINDAANALMKAFPPNVIEGLMKFHGRWPGEHPLDWIERVGPVVSGHNITPSERWRFERLNDWWTPDDVYDEYGIYWPTQPDLWAND